MNSHRRATALARRVDALAFCISFALLTPFSASAAPFAGVTAELREQVQQHEMTGDLAGARLLLQKNADTDSGSAQALAEFLCNHGDSACRDAYGKWATLESDPTKKKLILRQIVLLDFVNGKTNDLPNDLKLYQDLGEIDLKLPPKRSVPSSYSLISIPGPLSSFARMAALSVDLAPEDLLPALARNVVTNGYEASGNESLQQTEYLRLLNRYIGQARELQSMAGSDRKIVIPTCDSDQTAALLKILGYRMRGSCGADIVLETVNPTRAFLTVDSGFPLTPLEQDLRANRRFELPYAPTSIPVLYDVAYWAAANAKSNQGDFLDGFLSDPQLCRMYLGLSHLDRNTAEVLRKQSTPARLKVYSHVLDFYGGMFQIRDGAAVVPGSVKAWTALAGASPSNPGAFFEKLLSTDDGWLCSYFDALSRIEGPTASYLTQPDRMKRFYDALRGKVTTPGPARPVFRSSTELMLLTTSLRIDGNGQPHVPGNLEVWRTLFIKHPHGKYDGKLTRSAGTWRSSDDLLEALFGLSRKSVENEPLRIFLALSDMDRGRGKPISPELATRLVNAFRAYGAQYNLFSETDLSEASIGKYLELMPESLHIRDISLRADNAGTLQSLVELFRVLCRQESIPAAIRDATFAKLIEPFAQVKQEAEIFDAGRSGVDLLLSAAEPKASGTRQERILLLLVGKLHEGTPLSRADYFARVFDSQRLVALDSLFTAADKIEKGTADAKSLKSISDQLKRLAETEPSRGSLSSEEKSTLAVGYWSEKHVDQERKLNVDSLLKGSEKKDPRSLLAPLLRDSLVGLLYCYYAPPGAQLLLTNPLLVRSHDFIGPEGTPSTWRNTEVAGSGWPESAGGRLNGSLISLPYAIAEAEQNFLTPRREQALIWADLVPQLIASVTINRWRAVSPDQLRWVSLNVQRGKTLLAAAALNNDIQIRVLDSMRRFMPPGRVEWIQSNLQPEQFVHALVEVPTAVLYAIAIDPSLKDLSPDNSALEITSLMSASDGKQFSMAAISRAFGTPKPTLTHSLQPGLLHLRTFPALMGFSSRILAESWESNSLYYAALADEIGVPAAQLDNYVPEWNRAAIENIFATHLEDWPALLRSLDALGQSVRQHGAQAVAMNTTTEN